MANERFGHDRYAKIGILTGLNYVAQGFGSIVISPLIKRFSTRNVLSTAVILFALVSAIILIVDAATGGVLKFQTSDNMTQYGNWDPNGV
jgi:MFS family permease